ncbi:MAG: 23S rRNA (adenine(2503)-C(2))-methyltransferase RlmN [Candidatus Latescibacterota bacterium]
MNDHRTDLKGMTPDELALFITSLGKEKYRTKQLLSWIYARGVSDFEKMSDLSREFREQLSRIARVSAVEEVGRRISEDGTTKFLFQLEDGLKIESVLIREDPRRTVCLSSQVGCALGCAFCATGKMGFTRNLTSAEIVDQLIAVRRSEESITNVVLMGMGEPLLNYDNVLKAVRLMNLEMGISIGMRKITLSTSGIVPAIERLAREGLQMGLAISLNARDENTRTRLMPINRRYPLAELLSAVRKYGRTTRRRVTFEYILISGVNDNAEDAEALVGLLRDIPCKINLIPLNPVAGNGLERPAPERIERFRSFLLSHHFTVPLRESKGRNIAAACGQLRAEGYRSETETPV